MILVPVKICNGFSFGKLRWLFAATSTGKKKGKYVSKQRIERNKTLVQKVILEIEKITDGHDARLVQKNCNGDKNNIEKNCPMITMERKIQKECK